MIKLYAAAFEKVAARIGSRVEHVRRENEEAAALLADLLREPGARRRQRVQEDSRLWQLKLCERLESASREAWAEDAAAAVELAQLAVDVGERLDVLRYGEALVQDAQAQAWAYLGNAWRIASDLGRAERALARAEELQRKLQIDPATEAEILGFQASLRNAQGRFPEAARLLDRAVQLYRELGDRHQEGRALILKGTVLGDGGALQAAVHALRAGLARIDPKPEPRLLLVAHHNLVLYLSDAGRNAEALAALQESRRLYLKLGSRMDLVRLRWVEGRILEGLGRLAEAERALSLARDAFLEQEIWLDAALVGLDLAIVHARRGDGAAARRIAVEVFPVFQSCQVHPEALAALTFLRDSANDADTRRIPAGALDRIEISLRRARRNPGARLTESSYRSR